jgi:hypothetical protein
MAGASFFFLFKSWGGLPFFLFCFIIDLKTESAGTAREDKRERRRRRTGKFHENLCRHTSPAEKTKKENKKKTFQLQLGKKMRIFLFLSILAAFDCGWWWRRLVPPTPGAIVAGCRRRAVWRPSKSLKGRRRIH